MAVPRMNWKRFISTGALETRATTANNQKHPTTTRTKKQVAAAIRKKVSLRAMIVELDRLLIQNDIVIEAIDDAKHPFHLVAYEFVDTQLYDSRHLSAEFSRRLTTVKQTVLCADKKTEKSAQADCKHNLTVARKKLKKLAEQVKYLQKSRTIRNYN